MECVEVCKDDALRPVTQTEETVDELRRQWDLWLDLPTTPKKFIRVSDLEEGAGALETILLDKHNYMALASGDGACNGCSEKTALHLFVATVEALMQNRVQRHLVRLDDLIGRLEKHIQLKISSGLDVSDPDTIAKLVAAHQGKDLTVASLADSGGDTSPIDQEWLGEMTGLLSRLRDLRWKYQGGTTGRGRTSLGMINATGCTSVWGSTYPFNPYPFPWSNHLFQDTASIAMGVFEGHMAKMAEGFAAIRQAELELSGEWNERKHREIFQYFTWRNFTDEEWELCPPVVAVGGDGAMYDIGFQNLSRLMMSGKPIKVVVLDTQVYSNTGGQACTSGFIGQVSDMAQYGKVQKGKEEVRKEIGLIGMAHRTTYVLQSSVAHANHMIAGFIEGLKARRPALFNIYTSCQPEHGIGDDMGAAQAKLAVESRAYPLFRYNPDHGPRPEDCFELEGNPSPDDDWPTYTLTYHEHRREKTMEVPLTFADFAMTEARFRKHFRRAPRDTWNEKMVPLAEFLDLDTSEREDAFPYIWTVGREGELGRLLVSHTMVLACEERRDFWVMLRAIAGVEASPVEDVESKVRREVVGKIAAGLMELASGNGKGSATAALEVLAGDTTAASAPDSGGGDYIAPWIETEECTACDECIKVNPQVFVYNDQKKAFIADAGAGTFKDMVLAAERCTAGVIHPGMPRERDPATEKLIKRAEPFN
jgi:pyruvate-ferredoxin/flavodoxin oxidoreductase